MKKEKNLEYKLRIFLGLLSGGFGLALVSSTLSFNVTGNVIGNLGTIDGIVGIILLLIGVATSYFYFKEK